jgi:predicted nucleic acid-binding Zn ribbon protein
MPDLLREMGVRPADKLREVKAAWLEAAGAHLAEQARVTTLKNGILTLAVESPSVRFEIEQIRQKLLIPKLQALLPNRAVTRLKCIIA